MHSRRRHRRAARRRDPAGDRRLRIAQLAAEAAPFAKTGGLGDAVAGLTRYLARAGHDVRLFMPLYAPSAPRIRDLHPVDFARDVPLRLGPHDLSFTLRTAPLPNGGPWVYLIDCPALYDRPGIYTGGADDALRFAFLARAALESCQRMGWGPEVVHCHDWHAALAPLYLRAHYRWDQLFAGSRTLLTIHNVGYQGVFAASAIGDLDLAEHAALVPAEDRDAGRLNFLRAGIVHADRLSTVSPTHALEIQTSEYGAGLDSLLRARSAVLSGILNGVDEEWNPATDPLLPVNYSRADLRGKLANRTALLAELHLPAEPRLPLAGVVTRLTKQKGIDLYFDTLPAFLAQRGLQLVALGSGEARYESFFERLQAEFPAQVVFHRGYSNELAHRIEAAADLFLMPSLYEPCGLNQMYSLRYGTPPVVRNTGGLADSVRPFDPETQEGTGFLFDHFTPEGLAWALGRALDTFADPHAWTRLVRNGMAQDFSWDHQGGEYVRLYRRLTG